MAASLKSEQALDSDVGRTVRPSRAVIGAVGPFVGEASTVELPGAGLGAGPPEVHAVAALRISNAANPPVRRLEEDIGAHAHDEPIAGGGGPEVAHDVAFAKRNAPPCGDGIRVEENRETGIHGDR